MKKLMTLLSAAAVAFGLQAADTGTSFEGLVAGDLDIESSTGELSGESGFWTTNEVTEAVSLTVVNDQSVPRSSPYRPQQFQVNGRNSQTNYLKIASKFGNPVSRKVKTSGGEVIDPDSGSFYFDSLVKFTAFDEDPMGTAVTNDFDGAKIAVWVQEAVDGNDVVTGTNLWVRAGFLNEDSTVSPTNYNCGALRHRWFDNGWNRLTIKAIRNIYKSGTAAPGFVVFVDGEQVGSSAEKGIDSGRVSDKYEGFNDGSLFPSLVTSGQSATVLTSVSFDGQGDVDDMVFTATAPDFAKDEEYVYINWTPADIAALTIDETVLTSEQIAAGSYKVTYADDLSVAVSATYVEGKLEGAWTTTGGATVDDGTFSFTASEETGTIVAANAAASFGGTPYATLAGAIAAAEEASATLPPPVLKLYSTSASDDIEIAPNTLIVIDLNGQTIGGITTKGALKIIDSSEGQSGTVTGEVYLGEGSIIAAGTFSAMVTVGDGSVIEGGTFDEMVDTENDFIITGGRFDAYYNDPDDLPADEGYAFFEGTGDDAGYYVLLRAFGFKVTAGANSYVSNVSIDHVDVTEAVTNRTLEVIASNATWSVTFAANSGYEFEGGLTTTNFTGTAEAAVDQTGPDASSTSPSEPTIKPGDTSIDNVKASSEADATNKVVVASPASSIVSNADYKKYFTVTAQETATGVYTVTIELNEEAIELPETLEDVGGDLQDAAAAFGEDEDASFTGIAAKPGLWYWIDTATDPAFTENVTHGTAVFAEGTTVDLEAIKPDNADNAVFFRVCVDTVQRVW